MIKQRAAVVIMDKKKILLLHRFSNAKEYYVCPGGSVDDGETVEEAAIREALEETGLAIQLGNKLWQYKNLEFGGRTENFFEVVDYKGQLELGGPEASRNSETDSYELVWLSMEKLKEVKFFPEDIKINILNKFLGNTI